MLYFLILIIIIAIIYLAFFRNKKQLTPEQVGAVNSHSNVSPIIISDNDEREVFIDEIGKKYRIANKTRDVPRRTYLLGHLKGKYWGDVDKEFSENYLTKKFFNFTIYEADVSNAQYQFYPFKIKGDVRFSREKLPKVLPVILERDGKEYELNILEPIIADALINRKLHQDEGDQVFGTIDAEITGYVLDFVKEQYTEREYIHENKAVPLPLKETLIIKTLQPTGNVERNRNYKRTEYYCNNYKDTYWGSWIYTKPIGDTQQEGCFSSGVGILGAFIGIAFLLLLLPRLAILLPFIILPILFRLIPTVAWTWIFRIIGGLLFFAFIFSFVNAFNNSSNNYKPKPVVQDNPQERTPQYDPITDTLNKDQTPDTLITHFRRWQDYDGKNYEGKFWVRKSAFIKANNYKSNLTVTENSEKNYDKIVYALKENDKQNLDGVYQLFDSLNNVNHLSAKGFAETIVSFVQDIPYVVVLSDACDPSLYADNFIKKYLSSENARCDGYEKFGINTPVEYMQL